MASKHVELGDFMSMEEKLIEAYEERARAQKKVVSARQLMFIVEKALSKLPKDVVDEHLEVVYDVLYELAEEVAGK